MTRVAELASAADAIRHHHERFDGSGYPDGLAGDEIPIVARVVAVGRRRRVPAAARRSGDARARARRLPTGSASWPARRSIPRLVAAAIGVLAAEAQAAGEYLPRTA